MEPVKSELSVILYKDLNYIYGINTRRQFVVLDSNLKQIPNIVSNIASTYSFCMNGYTIYMCTQCKDERQILKFTLTTVPEPVFTQEEIPLLTHMFYRDGYICANTESEVIIYDVATNKVVPQPSRSYISNLPNDNELKQQFSKGSFQGIVGYKDSLYLKKKETMMGYHFGETTFEIPFRLGILDYTRMKVPNPNENLPLQLLSQVFVDSVDTENTPRISYDNVRIQITPVSQSETFEINYGKTLVQAKNPLLGINEDIYSSSVTLSDNFPVLPTYSKDPNVTLAYIVPLSYTDTILCKTGPGPGPDDFIGTICFLSGSMVLTDQGPIAIEFIVPYVHTLSNKTIVGISITYSCEDTLVCIERNSISKFVPNKDTFLSNNHKIYYKGHFLEACQFLGRGIRGIYTIPYENQLLYNVILEEHDIMNVNNLICETLDPSNPIAKEFISVFRE